MNERKHGWNGARGFLGALARDVRANTLVIMTIALIPLAGMIGGGIDISRMYIVKTRLQHACDAGALAGRKAMGGGIWAQKVNGIDNYPRVSAEKFFDANYNNQAYGALNVTRSFSENAGKVTGAAQAALPMTLMKVFGHTTETLNVACDAEMRLPNTDVMFVLDVTGSMNDKAINSDPQTKIQALRSSVKCFYEIVARLDTNENCAGGAPSGGVGPEVQVRFGFVPYDMNVNVGKLLPSNWFADKWTYQSRQVATVWGLADSHSDSWANWSNWSQTKRATTSTQADCQNNYGADFDGSRGDLGGGKNESNGGIQGGGNWQADQPWRDTDRNFQSWQSGTDGCRYQERTRDYTRTFSYHKVAAGTANAVAFNAWHYGPIERDITQLKSGNEWNPLYRYSADIANGYGTGTYTWDGCVEERHTVRETNYSPIPSGANDLDIDSTPNSSDANTQWGPALDDVIIGRRQNYNNNSSYSTNDITTFTNFSTNRSYDCPTTAKKLQAWNDPSTFDTYVDGMWGGGNTYHDIGLVWGARLLSPTGIFRSENEFTPKGGEIQRHLIFMTDGDACTSEYNYQAYGIAWWDRRQTDPNQAPTSGCTTTGTLTQQVNARTQALCSAVKNKNITLWVIWFGAKNNTIEDMLKTCATTDRYFAARNQADLQKTFQSIASEISQLRLTK
ncbi:TadE/TadG family type IV pilus assembly protein [Sphingomonas sp. dw_22]|uniref:TadE/TadG family type IV pilus assembly protein n=1 Tax=Sphingomonas sp. dw_22 TaxID=2721175 RepID=UPI001BD2324D|nr:TadE/TadG family type IV pilus assembly protein [Sphingomonas sp. dw_22]